MDLPIDEQATAITQARRVTAEYMATKKIRKNQQGEEYDFIWLPNGEMIYFEDWRPDKDYNQLMMVVDKMKVDLYGIELIFRGGDTCKCRIRTGTDYFDHQNEDLGIALLLCITKALEAKK